MSQILGTGRAPEDPGNKEEDTQEEKSVSVENDRSTKQKLNDLVCISSYLRTVINYFLKSLEIEKAVSFSCCSISVLFFSLRMNIPSQSHIVYTHLHVFMQMMCNLYIFLGSYLASFSYYILLIFLSSLLV